MKVDIIPTILHGKIKAPADKSEIIRYIIISALRESECTIRNINLCDDVLACMDCVENMEGEMDAGASATVLRLLLPAVVRKYGKADFICDMSLLARPFGPYKDIFRIFEINGNRLHAEGLIEKEVYRPDPKISSQFFSGLAIAGLNVQGRPESDRYYELTREILGKKFPVDITIREDETLRAFWEIGRLRIDSVSENPDMAPCWALQAALGSGETLIPNAGRLRYKECDRLHGITVILNALGADVTEGSDYLLIRGVEHLKGGCEIDSLNDHRMAMMAAVAAQWCDEPIRINGVECVSKSYPNFFDDYERLGGKISVF